jgi:endonuclease III
MKDSSQYSKKIQKLYRNLKKHPVGQADVEYDEPVDAIVHAAISENLTEQQTQSAIKKLRDYFVDWNDLRVASIDEIVEVLGPDITSARGIAATLVNPLKAVFEKYNMLTLQPLKKLGKRPAKQVIEKFNGVTPFIIDYCMLTALEGHAIPLTPKMVEYLRTAELVFAQANYDEIEGFLTRQISAKNACEFYSLLRRASESPKAHSPKKTRSAKKTRNKQ